MSRSRAALLVSVFASAGLLACGGEDGMSPNLTDDVSMAGSPAGPDDTSLAGSSGLGDAPSELNGCKANAYQDVSGEDAERVVQIAADGLVFTPPCIAIVAGQSIRFLGSLTAHPLAPGNAEDAKLGSPDNPITATSTGNSVEFTFEKPGTYAYFCELHGFGDGKGMSGAVHVRAAE